MIDILQRTEALKNIHLKVSREYLLIGCLLFYLLVASQTVAAESATQYKGVRDFAAYWASDQLLLSARNPYSPVELLELQRALGWNDKSPLVMWNPPWTFAVTLPFGLLDFTAGQFFWLLLHVALLLISNRLLWRLYGDSADRHRWVWLLTVSFVPTVFVLILGQIVPLVLMGLVGFVYLERSGKKFAAGAALTMAMVKPHFIYLFWLAWLLWLVQERQNAIFLGAFCALLLAALMPLFFDASVYHQYVTLFRSTDLQLPLDLPAPTLRNVARLLLNVDSGSWQVLPMLLAVAWLVFYWWRHRVGWQWSDRLPLILLVSLVTSTYTWTFDQVIFLPALLQASSWLVRQRFPWYSSLAALLYIGINLGHLILRFFVAEELWYFWLAPALLIAYLVFRWEEQHRPLLAT